MLGFLGIGGLVRFIAPLIVGGGLGFLVDRVVFWDERRGQQQPPGAPPASPPPPGTWPPPPPPGNGHP